MQAAECVAERMQSEAGLPPSRVVFNTLIRGHCKAGTLEGQVRWKLLKGQVG